MTPYFDRDNVTIYNGHVLAVLRELPAESVHCCVTSPPYWGLRDYGTATWEGGDAKCDHRQTVDNDRTERERKNAVRDDDTGNYAHPSGWSGGGRASVINGHICGKCGARLIDQQIGLESTPEEFVAVMVEVFREVRRVMRPDAVMWLNIGDSYTSGNRHGHGTRVGYKQSTNRGMNDDTAPERCPTPLDPKAKDLVGVPWRVAFALQADGWYLRSDCIWAKPNPMPESVTDRPTKAHEYVFLLSKSARYFYDAEAVREDAIGPPGGNIKPTKGAGDERMRTRNGLHIAQQKARENGGFTHRNLRTVWTIPTQAYHGSHFATFPEDLVERCLLAGTSAEGCCAECGKPWERVVDTEYDNPGNRTTNGPRSLTQRHETAGFAQRLEKRITTTGWRPTCTHNAPTVPCTVLDPFGGSGTTAAVAQRLGLRCILIELNEKYCRMAAKRFRQRRISV